MSPSTSPPRPAPTAPRPAPGPKPSGPTHPTPTSPPTRGHLPIGAAPAYPLPRLGEIIRDAERYLAQARAVLAREFEPSSGPVDDAGQRQAAVTLWLKCALADVGSAMHMIGVIAESGLPAAGSAVHIPPVPHAGESRTPGYAAVSAAPVAAGGGSPEVSPSSFGAGASFRQVMPGTYEIAAGINAALAGRSR